MCDLNLSELTEGEIFASRKESALLCLVALLLHLKRVSESTRRVWENVTTEYKLDKDRKQKRGARGQMDKSREAMLAQMGDHLQKPKVSLELLFKLNNRTAIKDSAMIYSYHFVVYPNMKEQCGY